MSTNDTRTLLLQRRDALVAELEDLNKALEAIGEQPVALRGRRRRRDPAPQSPNPARSQSRRSAEASPGGLAGAILSSLPAGGGEMSLEELVEALPEPFADKKKDAVAASLSYLKTRKGLVENPRKGVYRRAATQPENKRG